jgi:hypothetical protein
MVEPRDPQRIRPTDGTGSHEVEWIWRPRDYKELRNLVVECLNLHTTPKSGLNKQDGMLYPDLKQSRTASPLKHYISGHCPLSSRHL